MGSQGYTVFLRWNEMGELEALPPCCATCRCRWMGQLKYVCIQPLPARGSEEIQGGQRPKAPSLCSTLRPSQHSPLPIQVSTPNTFLLPARHFCLPLPQAHPDPHSRVQMTQEPLGILPATTG